MTGLTIRRHHRGRMVIRARRLYPGVECPQRYATDRTRCSCYMCGNPRRWFGILPAQWRRELERTGVVDEGGG
jgi:hypothetical protein